MTRIAPAALLVLLGCGYEEPPCPGLPDDMPADWSVAPDGLDTAEVDALVEEHMRAGCIPGLSVSVVDADGAILTATWGWANIEAEIPATTETPFMIASVSKAFDALAVLAAMEQGLVDLDDSVSDLVGFPVENHRTGGGPPIQLKHLVTHSSSIKDNYDVIFDTYTTGDSPLSLGAYLSDYLTPDGAYFDSRKNFHLWPAGREFMYSNIGSALAAYAVEVQSGSSFDTYSRTHVLEPMGAQDAGWFLADFDDPDAIARPHVVDDDGWRVVEHYGYPSYPDGQLRATGAHLGQLLRIALGDGTVDGVTVVSEASARHLGEPPVDGLADWYLRAYLAEQYLFWFAMDLDDRRLVGHDGDDEGVTAEVFYEPATGVGVALVANIGDGGDGARVRSQTTALQHMLFELGEVHR